MSDPTAALDEAWIAQEDARGEARGGFALLPLLVLSTLHALVDLFALAIQPLWPDLQHELAAGEGIGWAYMLWAATTSFSQFFFGYYGDRYHARWLLWAGPLIGIVALSLIGLADSLPMLAVLLVVGGLGIAAFHPEAAALAGSCAPEHRSRAMSIFATGGFLGQAFGPLYSGALTTNFGLPALAWGALWGAALLVPLAIGLRRAPILQMEATRPAIGLLELVRRRGRAMGLLIVIGMLRVLPAMGVPLALAFMIKDAGGTNEDVGLVQSALLFGIGLGGVACATWHGRVDERRVLWIAPLAIAPLVSLAGSLHGWWLAADVAAAGLLIGYMMPMLVSLGQQLLPEGQRIASSLTMGVTWGLGGIVVAPVMTMCNEWGHPEWAMHLFAASLLVSSFLCIWLPWPAMRARPSGS